MSQKEIGFELKAPPGTGLGAVFTYRLLTCINCNNNSEFEIALADNGQWSIECLSCFESTALFSDLINNLK